MGIRSAKASSKSNLPMFSSDILKIEISGPEVSAQAFGLRNVCPFRAS